MELITLTPDQHYGHKVALKFAFCNSSSKAIEAVCKKKLGGDGTNTESTWRAWLGKYNPTVNFGLTPYFISFRNEADATLVLLSADLTKKP
jgi:hypothetical protein